MAKYFYFVALTIAMLLIPSLSTAFEYSSPGDDLFVDGEQVAAVHMNQIDAALDALEAAISGDITGVGDCTGPICFSIASPDAHLVFDNATSGTITLKAVTGALGTQTLFLPAATDTLVGKATIATLTNKTLGDATNTITIGASDTITTASVTLSSLWQDAQISNTLTATAAESAFTIGSITQDGTLVLHDDDAGPGGDATVTIQAADATGSSWVLTLPADDGDAVGEKFLKTDGSGDTEWALALGTELDSATNDITSSTATTGIISLGASTGSAEKITFDFGTTSNEVQIGTTTGVTHIDFGALGINMNTSENITWNDTATLDWDGSDFVFNGDLIADSFTAMPSDVPTAEFKDSDFDDDEVSASILVECDDVITEVEDCDMRFNTKKDGNLTEAFRIDTTDAGVQTIVFAAMPDLDAGSHADSAVIESDSGLELVGGYLTLLRGCNNNEILKWDETDDDWNCEVDSGGDTHSGTVTWDTSPTIESGTTFGWGDASDNTITHSYNNTGVSVDIAFSTGAMAVTGAFTATTVGSDSSPSPGWAFDDSAWTGTQEGNIGINCPSDNDCDMTFGVESGQADVLLDWMTVDTTESGITTVTIATDEANDAALTVPENSIGPDEAAIPMQSFFFCGELGNATDTFHAGPNMVSVLTGAVPTDHTFGSAACDALGDTDGLNVDVTLDADTGYKINGMFCQITGTTTAATVMTVTDDAGATPTTCSISPGKNSCASVIGTTADVAAGSLMTVSSLNGIDDLREEDMHCLVYISWK